MADNSNSIIAWILVGGGGSVLGGLVTTVFNILGSRGKDRADAADLATSAASRMIKRLEEENTRMRGAILTLTDILDTVIDDLDIPEVAKKKLKAANRAAKMSV